MVGVQLLIGPPLLNRSAAIMDSREFIVEAAGIELDAKDIYGRDEGFGAKVRARVGSWQGASDWVTRW